jgi:hypothetical protein
VPPERGGAPPRAPRLQLCRGGEEERARSVTGEGRPRARGAGQPGSAIRVRTGQGEDLRGLWRSWGGGL